MTVSHMLEEVSPGGVGTGLYGMLVFVLLAVFIAGPDGRPHTRWLGKVQAREVKLAVQPSWSYPHGAGP